MRKLKSLVFIYILLLTLSVIVYSCCSEKLQIIAIDRVFVQDDEFRELDSIHGEFTFQLHFRDQTVASLSDLSLINGAYATSCDYTYVNELLLSSLEIYCDQDIVHYNDTVFSGTDLITMNTLNSGYKSSSFGNFVTVGVSRFFLKNAKFEKGPHLFNFKIKTSDSKQLEGNVSLYMDL